MRYVTSRQLCLWKSSITLQLSHSSNPLLMSHSPIIQPTQNQMLVLISVVEVFGTQAKMHFFLILGFSIQTRQPLLLHTASNNQQNRESMPNVYVKWSMVFAHPLFSQQPVEWAVRLLLFRRHWLMETPGRSKKKICRHGVDLLSFLLCNPLLCHPIHLWNQILWPLPSPRTKHSTS